MTTPPTGGPRNDDEVLDAFDALVRVLARLPERTAAIGDGATVMRDGRARGATYTALLTGSPGPHATELVTRLLADVAEAGARLRRAEARALYEEGLSMEEVGRVLRVSRQRVSTLLRTRREK